MPRPVRRRFARALASLALAALPLAGCTPAAITAQTGQADGVNFAYALSPGAALHQYHLALTLQDTATGKAIAGDNLVNLRRDPQATAPTYVADIDLPQTAAYRLTFQVNRHLAPSAQATFSTPPPAT